MVGYVAVAGTQPSAAGGVVLALLRMQPPSSGPSAPGFCATRTLTATSKVGLEAGVQMGVAVAMVVVYCTSWGVARALAACRPSTARAKPSGRPTSQLSSRGLSLPQLHEPLLALRGPRNPLNVQVGLTQRARLVAAGVNFGLTAYATLTVAVVKLLHCVWVPGTPAHTRHLFIRGTVACDYGGWQAPYFVALGVLVSVPLALPWLAAWSARGEDGGEGAEGAEGPAGAEAGAVRGVEAAPSGQWMRDVRNGVRSALVASYSPRTPWWESVLLVQRLVGVLHIALGCRCCCWCCCRVQSVAT
jgi:hypothetical protein